MEELANKGLITKSEGAQVISIAGQKSPLIVVKRDGGFNYASTDLAALWSVVKKKQKIANFSPFRVFTTSPEGTNSCYMFSVLQTEFNSSCRGNSIALDFVNSALFFPPRIMKVSA